MKHYSISYFPLRYNFRSFHPLSFCYFLLRSIFSDFSLFFCMPRAWSQYFYFTLFSSHFFLLFSCRHFSAFLFIHFVLLLFFFSIYVSVPSISNSLLHIFLNGSVSWIFPHGQRDRDIKTCTLISCLQFCSHFFLSVVVWHNFNDVTYIHAATNIYVRVLMFIIRFAAKALTNLNRKETKNEISTETQKHIERTYGRVFCVCLQCTNYDDDDDDGITENFCFENKLAIDSLIEIDSLSFPFSLSHFVYFSFLIAVAFFSSNFSFANL